MKRTISVVGSATTSVEPDLASTTCGVHVHGVNAQDVLRRSNEAMQGIVDALVGVGIDRSDLRTSGPRLFPTDTGYQGSNDLAILVRDLASLGSVIDTMVAAGGPDVTMHGVEFSVAEPGVHLPALRRAAMDAARAIAGQLAEAGGAAVGQVVTIAESSGYQAPVMLAMDARGRSTKGTPVEAGEQQLRVDVNVTYRLVDPD